ncbi:MAG TPA: hypothetical protein VE912_00425, partial [Bacteroidales bacterium]|nr:hypothetical protein [Bacteroidales bacterium]
GVNLLFTSFWYEHNIAPAKQTPDFTENTTIYGPLCMNIDIIREAVQFPPLDPGDNVVISRIGAYNMTQWMQFITYRPSIIIITKESSTEIIRKAEDHESMNQQEHIPEHLKDFTL